MLSRSRRVICRNSLNILFDKYRGLAKRNKFTFFNRALGLLRLQNILDGAGQIKAELLTVPPVRTDSRDAPANKLLEMEECRSSLTVGLYTFYNLVL